MVHGTVLSHEGIILTESEADHGACFDIYIPLLKDEGSEESAPLASTKSEEDANAVDETILIVDDSEQMLESISDMLRSVGYNIIQASSGSEATALFQSNPRCCQVVLMDIVMPNMSGVEAARIISDISPNTPILFFSAYSNDDSEQPDIVPEGSTLIKKPVAPDDLIQVIRETLKG